MTQLVTPGLAAKLITIFGHEVIAKLEVNPYLPLAFTSWTQADELARAASIAPNDPRRLVAAAESVAYKRLRSHQTWTPSDLFIELLNNQLSSEAAPAIAQAALALAIQDRAVVAVDNGIQGLGPYSMDTYVGERLATIASGNVPKDGSTATGIVATPTGLGYYIVMEDGGVFAFGDAISHGSTGGNKPGGHSVTGIALSVADDGKVNGYWLVAEDGAVYTFGEAQFWGNAGSNPKSN
jgi:Helix-hairpin-helix containing domain